MANLVQIVFNWNFEDLQMARHPGAGKEKWVPGLAQTGLSSLCHFPLQQPRAGAAGGREAKWAPRVLGSLRAAPPKGQLWGRH